MPLPLSEIVHLFVQIPSCSPSDSTVVVMVPFAQEKNDARSVYQGTGLGMAIVKELIDQMKGTIEISSEVGVGSTFVVTIPFEISPPPQKLPYDSFQEFPA